MCRTKTSKSPHAFAMCSSRKTRTLIYLDFNLLLTNRNLSPITFRLPWWKKYWKFNLHLCQEQLRNVAVSQFSSCFSWDDWFCESYTSYTRINYACFKSWEHSPQHSILWFCNIRAVKKKISIFYMYIPCEASSWTLLHQNRNSWG